MLYLLYSVLRGFAGFGGISILNFGIGASTLTLRFDNAFFAIAGKLIAQLSCNDLDWFFLLCSDKQFLLELFQHL